MRPQSGNTLAVSLQPSDQRSLVRVKFSLLDNAKIGSTLGLFGVMSCTLSRLIKKTKMMKYRTISLVFSRMISISAGSAQI